jgi:bifunctional DNA-binding transcriptional regulator/antitoxin component of YhaV-PrlF toxin-antitoxin module
MLMDDTLTVQLAQRGVVVLPKSLRDRYHLEPGDTMTLLDIGGVFVLSPRHSQVDALANRLTQGLIDQGETLESMLRVIREEREHYGREE